MIELDAAEQQQAVGFRRNSLVIPAYEVTEIQSPDSDLVPHEILGPGIVRGQEADGKVLVHWAAANFDTLADPDELRALDARAHLITIYHCDGKGIHTDFTHKVVTTAGMEHNWRAEIRPGHLVRAIRDDHAIWTFRWIPLLNKVSPIRNELFPPTGDEEAEALIVAQHAVSAFE